MRHLPGIEFTDSQIRTIESGGEVSIHFDGSCDRAFVKQAFAYNFKNDRKSGKGHILYRSDNEGENDWRPAREMEREFSRTLVDLQRAGDLYVARRWGL